MQNYCIEKDLILITAHLCATYLLKLLEQTQPKTRMVNSKLSHCHYSMQWMPVMRGCVENAKFYGTGFRSMNKHVKVSQSIVHFLGVYCDPGKATANHREERTRAN
jgi:hypothetical protein